MPRFILAPFTFVLCIGTILGYCGKSDLSFVTSPPLDQRNAHYVCNREPLLPNPLIKLPLGAVQPQGWLRKQLELQAAGFHGHLMEISTFLKKDKNAWLSPQGQGERGW